jgi:hypothetical protein
VSAKLPPMNPLIARLGVTRLRCNGGDEVATHPTLLLKGFAVVDDEVNKRALATPGPDTDRISYDATADSVDDDDDPILEYSVLGPSDWFGVDAQFDASNDIYVTTVVDGVKFGGFGVPTVVRRKTLTNAGAHTFEVYNFRLEDDAGDYNTPGMVQGFHRTLRPGESLRLQWDPIGLRWLVNDGLVSAEILTHDHETLTCDGETLTGSL